MAALPLFRFSRGRGFCFRMLLAANAQVLERLDRLSARVEFALPLDALFVLGLARLFQHENFVLQIEQIVVQLIRRVAHCFSAFVAVFELAVMRR